MLNQINVPHLTNNDDTVVWTSNDNKETKFSTKVAWLSLKENWPKVEWSKVVWFSQCNPKQAFILWMAIQGKLLTQDRMMSWYKGDPLKCSLCKKEADNHKHLFFECHYAEKVEYLSGKKLGNKIHHIANRLIISSTVYHIWNERNKRNFQNTSRSLDELIGYIEKNFIDLLLSLNVKKSPNVSMVANMWGLKWEKGKLTPSRFLAILYALTKYSPEKVRETLKRANYQTGTSKTHPLKFSYWMVGLAILKRNFIDLAAKSGMFLSRKSFDTLADHLQEVMVKSLPIMVDTHIKEQVKKQVPEQVRDQVLVYVAEGLILERQKTKEEMEHMISKDILQERGNIQAEISSKIHNAIDNHIPS
ncbi:reverse transcriptase zinc-binding domain-containing protein [Tanacetum coccineum]